jgi:hypothetical protein
LHVHQSWSVGKSRVEANVWESSDQSWSWSLDVRIGCVNCQSGKHQIGGRVCLRNWGRGSGFTAQITWFMLVINVLYAYVCNPCEFRISTFDPTSFRPLNLKPPLCTLYIRSPFHSIPSHDVCPQQRPHSWKLQFSRVPPADHSIPPFLASSKRFRQSLLQSASILLLYFPLF